MFKCDRCLKQFALKTNLIRHLKRKIPCKIINDNFIDHNNKTENEEESTVNKMLTNVNEML